MTGLAVAASGAARAAGAEARGLFWTATPPGEPPSFLFGYARTAAAVTADIVKDGDRFAEQAQRVVADIPNVQFARISLPHDRLPPISGRVSAATADRIRAVIDKSFSSLPNKDKLSGFETALLLHAEGQTPAQPSVGGTIAEHAQATGKPIAYLVSADEAKAAFHPPDPVALDQRINEQTLVYLLDLRDRLGPIGKYEESLYTARRTDDLSKLGVEMKQHGALTTADLLPTSTLEETILARALQAVQTPQDRAFLMVAVGTLTRDGGVLSKLRESGVQVALSA
ncbi:hypothetical protein [Methylocapsa sp. S129]|uniref:hypothetical protein n=1 Tax=Methylocapsa sp. S129 TaxID=1641869 RepID=UPI00131D235B|nr:hypothetical protein [Methylocapsa sp. S129]